MLKQYQSADLKSFWNWFGVSDLCKDFCKIFLFNDFDIDIEQKTFFWIAF